MVGLPGCNSQKMRGQGLSVNAGEFLAAARSLPLSALKTEDGCGQPHIPAQGNPESITALRTELNCLAGLPVG